MAIKVLVKDGKLATYGGKVVEVEASAADAIQHADIPDYIKPSEEKIYSFCYGAGYDREIFTGVQTVVDLIATYGAIDNIRLSTGSGTEKAAEGYVTVGHNAPIDVSKQTYPNGAIIRVTGAVNCKGNDWSTTPNGGDSAWSMYTNAAGTAYSHSDYITDKTGTIGPITLDADKTGFTVDLASLDKRWIKFCVKGTAANLTATLTPK